jgi:hypothetical protein
VKAGIDRRLAQLEQIAQQSRARGASSQLAAVLRLLDDADLGVLKHFVERLSQGFTLDDALLNCTQGERGAIERFNAVDFRLRTEPSMWSPKGHLR